MNSSVDVERELAALREQVRRTPASSETELTALQKAIALLNANWYISATLPPPAAGAPWRWRAVYFVKRVLRRIMVELLNTIVQQQNAFNLQVARALTELAMQEARVAELERRVGELEAKVNPREGSRE